MFKLPKSINISGKTYTVHKDPNSWGGCAGNAAQRIVVGTKKDRSQERICATFVHEVCESVMMERNLRFQSMDDEVAFMMTHKQFDDFAMDISSALFPLLNKGSK